MGPPPSPRRDDFSDDPFLTLLINVANMVAIMGGSLAAIFAIGYSDRGLGGWGPNVLILVSLVAANIALRVWRAHRRRRRWRHNHPDGAAPPPR